MEKITKLAAAKDGGLWEIVYIPFGDGCVCGEIFDWEDIWGDDDKPKPFVFNERIGQWVGRQIPCPACGRKMPAEMEVTYHGSRHR